MIKIGGVGKTDYVAIQRFLENAYGRLAVNSLPLYYPWCWHEDNTDYDQIYVIRQGVEIVSLVRVFPLELMQGGARVRVGGIGGVATAPAYAGKGYMSRLLNHALTRMRAEHFPLSILWGDRHCYQPFGYQPAGKMVMLTVTPRGLKKAGVEPLTPIKYAGQNELFFPMVRAYRAHPFRRLRTDEEFRRTYQHAHLLLFGAAGEERFGYLGLFCNASDYSVAEFGGDSRTVLGITAHLMQRLEIRALEFGFPNWQMIPTNFVHAASHWKIEPIGQMKILDVERTLHDFHSQSSEKIPITVNALKAMPETKQIEMLFGTANHSPFNIFLWPLDHF